MDAGVNAGGATAPRTGLDTAGVTEREAVFLHPGRVFASAAPATVRIILGSCVAVCLWDPLRRIGGANHFLLPYHGVENPQFADAAIRRLVKELLTLGCLKRRLLAKLFGGSCVVEAFQNKETQVGPKNVVVAHELLGYEGIPVLTEDVGGQRGRKVIFQTDDGSAWVRQL